jgi:hypothetical protein
MYAMPEWDARGSRCRELATGDWRLATEGRILNTFEIAKH